ncbi:MAG: hypothetical protein OQK48_02960 [Sulfurimonas sp.]|uniref:hypothetical protein n=1 Tax=Sulfurimonas sp. TaxID=2022749 RepID=UPI002601CBD8|nr:hypothetical protein [Sulfurimonas sp.]MCW8896324.1 hypothetical protein [Sulfurimonas sp.]MCW8953881.1 hypothetical protein [Sulfurimonas sp.]MCW9068122.1 hypothetical protein [Sulfurimonas sp.]
MKIAVECKSPLMQKSLELFLSNHLSSLKHCDIVIRDEKCLEDERCFYISSNKESDLVKPFSKSQLILALEKRYKSMNKDMKKVEYADDEVFEQSTVFDFEILEKRIESLTAEYQANILKAVRAFYEK